MDQEVLVDLVLEDGARLDIELSRRGVTLDSPIAAFDPSIEQWALLFGVPAEASRRQIYEETQSVIAQLGLGLGLDQVVLVKNNDPGLRELRELASTFRSPTWQTQLPPVEVAGRPFTSPRVIRPSISRYEDAVGDAIRGFLPKNASFQHRDSDSLKARHAHSEVAIGGRGLTADFVAAWNSQILLIEAKATRRPLSMQQALSVFGQLSYYQREFGKTRSVKLILVSMAGFTDAVKANFDNFADFLLVSWSINQDRTVFAEAIERLAKSM